MLALQAAAGFLDGFEEARRTGDLFEVLQAFLRVLLAPFEWFGPQSAATVQRQRLNRRPVIVLALDIKLVLRATG
jgi:hypothetical protein